MTEPLQQPATLEPCPAPADVAAPCPEPQPTDAPVLPGFWTIVLTPLTPGVLVDGTVHEYAGGGMQFNLATKEAHVSFVCQDRKAVAEALMTYLNLAPAIVGGNNVPVTVASKKGRRRKFMLRDLITVLASVQAMNFCRIADVLATAASEATSEKK